MVVWLVRRVTGGMYVSQGRLKGGIMAPSLLLNPPSEGEVSHPFP